jgi:hypothetical protein
MDKINENHHMVAALLAVITAVYSESLLLGAIIYIVVMVAILAHYSGKLPVIAGAIRTWWINRQGIPTKFKMYDILLGYDTNGRPQLENLKTLGHAFVAGATGKGKTVWYQGLLHWLIKTHTPDDLKIYISDAKRVSFSIWQRIPHLGAPIAVTKEDTALMIDLLLEEMDRRTKLFELYSHTQMCDNIEKYYKLTGEKLPRIIAFFDEKADAVDDAGEANDKLITLAKMSRSYGFNIFIGTQRVSAKVVSGELISQLATKISFAMASAREYGVVTQIPKDMYQHMTGQPGQMMIYTPTREWCFMQSRLLPDGELEKQARETSRGHTRPRWGTPVVETRKNTLSTTTKLQGSMNEKIAVIQAWANTLKQKPRIVDIENRYSVSYPTAKRYHERLK